MRGKIADDYIKAMKAIWMSHPSSHEGPYVTFKNAEIFPSPAQKPHPPIWVGGWTIAAMKRTSLLGDIWIPAWLTAKDIGERFQKIREMAALAGHPADAVQLGTEIYASIDKDSSTAKRDAMGTFNASRGTYERDMTL